MSSAFRKAFGPRASVVSPEMNNRSKLKKLWTRPMQQETICLLPPLAHKPAPPARQPTTSTHQNGGSPLAHKPAPARQPTTSTHQNGGSPLAHKPAPAGQPTTSTQQNGGSPLAHKPAPPARQPTTSTHQNGGSPLAHKPAPPARQPTTSTHQNGGSPLAHKPAPPARQPTTSTHQIGGSLCHPSVKPQLSNLEIHQMNVSKERPGTSKQSNLLKCIFGKEKVEPLSPADALMLHGQKLTDFERNEIIGYPEIWYLGLNADKIAGSVYNPYNSGYDNEGGHYIKVAHDHIAYRYEVLDVIGQGSFGQVLKCLDHKTDEMVALKIIRRNERINKLAGVEVLILNALREKDKDDSFNVVHMKEFFVFRNHLCITFELLGSSLYDLLKKRHHQGFCKTLVQRFARSLLECLQVLHKEKIVHCDLKPENILLCPGNKFDTKVTDFGCGCFEDERILTYVGSRWYRAPEVILRQPYDSAIDMWSFGCVIAELYTGQPILTGKNELDQLASILEVLGVPPTDFTQESEIWENLFDSKGMPKMVVFPKRYPSTRPLASILRTTDATFLDFLRRCLTWDPKKRMTAKEAMQHKWIVECCLKNPRQQQREPKHSTGKNKTETPLLKTAEKGLLQQQEKKVLINKGGPSKKVVLVPGSGPSSGLSCEPKRGQPQKLFPKNSGLKRWTRQRSSKP
ncbi:dual specificity tyrosine-phosphorylation-regulated kinase 4-like [Myxocyprinus asiaticus]|uniref:dual specificity tyrosine-phosphorylation-regulated kinase 4-like n=1 Tax=Myxocyprinus asiaticus TaxID=70543 RepID=UPI0022235A51|nr:dual specificity tyrosine-phosphorylation-regulated kinase 4-like [Myxocyprinus asiaticus]